MVQITPELITAMIGSEGVVSVVAAFAALKAKNNSEQLRRNSGSTVADAVARTEATLEKVAAVQVNQSHELASVNQRLKHLEDNMLTTREEIGEERKARRRDFAMLEQEIEDTISRKEPPK